MTMKTAGVRFRVGERVRVVRADGKSWTAVFHCARFAPDGSPVGVFRLDDRLRAAA